MSSQKIQTRGIKLCFTTIQGFKIYKYKKRQAYSLDRNMKHFININVSAGICHTVKHGKLVTNNRQWETLPSSAWRRNLLFGCNKCVWWICCVSMRRPKANVCEWPCASWSVLGMSAPSVLSTVGCQWATVTQTPTAGRCRPSSRWLMELWKQWQQSYFHILSRNIGWFNMLLPLMTVRTERMRLRIWALTPGSSPKPPTPWSTPQPTAGDADKDTQTGGSRKWLFLNRSFKLFSFCILK